METCRYCAQPIHLAQLGGYVHSRPMAELRVTVEEVSAIRADPPLAGKALDRGSMLHRAQP